MSPESMDHIKYIKGDQKGNGDIKGRIIIIMGWNRAL